MKTRRVIETHATRLVDASLAALEEWRSDDPLVPVVALAPSGTVARALVRAAIGGHGLAAGVRAMTLDDLARWMAARVTQRRPLPRLADRLAVAHLLARDPGPLRERACRPAVAAAVARTLRDVRLVGAAVLDREQRRDLLEGAGDLLHRREYEAFAHLVRLSDAFDDWLSEAGLYDDARLYALAAEADGAALAPRVLVHAIYDLTGSQRDLLDVLLPGVDATWVVPALPGDSPSRAIVEATRAWLHGKGFEAAAFDDAALPPAPEPRFVAAAGGRAEAREVVRGILDAAAHGVPFGEMAVLLASPAVQLPLFEEELARAQVPVTGRMRTSVADTPAGRLFAAALSILAGSQTSDDVAAVIGRAAETEPESGLTAAAALSLARRAGCFEADEASWKRRLGAHAGVLRWRAGRHEDDDATDEGDALRREADAAERLAVTAGRTLARLDGVRAAVGKCERERDAAAAWQRFGGLVATVAALLGLEPDELPGAPAFAAYGACGIAFDAEHALVVARELLGLFAGSPGEDPPPEHEADGRDDPAPRAEADLVVRPGSRRLGEAVLLEPLNRARGLRVARAWCAGFSDDLFASPATPDPILSDAVRGRVANASGVPLRTSARRAEEADLLIELAAAAGSDAVTLSWPRADDESGRGRFAADAIVRLAGEPDSSERVEKPPRAAPAHGEPGRPHLDAHEYDVAALQSNDPSLAAYLDERPELAAARRLHAARFVSRELTPFDGITGPAGDLPGSFSPTMLRRIAECPFRFFLHDRLGLRRPPEEALAVAPERLDLGRVAHSVLEALFEPFVGRAPGDRPAAEALLARIPALVGEHVQRELERGAAGAPSLWAGAARELAASLARIVLLECETLDAERRTVAELERERQARIEAGGVTLDLHGRPDRVDRDAAGTLVVTDYKNSADRSRFPDGRTSFLKGGRSLQLPVYARLVEDEAGEGAASLLRVVFLRADPGKEVRELDLARAEANEGDLDRLVAALVERVREGETFQVPDQRNVCSRCDFDALCGPRKERTAARKAGDERRAAHDALGEAFP